MPITFSYNNQPKITSKRLIVVLFPWQKKFGNSKEVKKYPRKRSHTSTMAKIRGFANNPKTSGGQGE